MHKKAAASLDLLLRGEIPEPIELEKIADPDDRELALRLNQLFEFMRQIHAFIIPLSQGQLQEIELPAGNYLASPFKELHSRLLHLTWQARQVAAGDYRQRVDFMGDFSEAFNSMVIALEEHERQLKNKIKELEEALCRIRKLEGILPICANCKKIRVENGNPQDQKDWISVEEYISENSEARFSHSLCPECRKKLYPAFDREG